MVNGKQYIKAPGKGVQYPSQMLPRIDALKGDMSRNAYMVRMMSHYLNLVEGGHIKPAGNIPNVKS